MLVANHDHIVETEPSTNGFYRKLWFSTMPDKIKIKIWRMFVHSVRLWWRQLCMLDAIVILPKKCGCPSEWLEELFVRCDQAQCNMICAAIWTLWHAGNLLYREGDKINKVEVVTFIRRHLLELKAIYDILSTTFPNRSDRLNPPISAVIKGLVMGADTVWGERVPDAFVVKAIASIQALRFVNIILERDARSILKRIEAGGEDRFLLQLYIVDSR
ncbi:hypothetical protein CXB51_024500 [Gossypium anomalum]|uniref:Reverse transcriptase zinc-binding domain-containing protein n=1 Tax=Gossypium anomalum TaxID=47600 RepID=A0A8J6CPQ0_9ROSI|nr:hypothetical protein CXB51_024500 [Gossypium anomalum]